MFERRLKTRSEARMDVALGASLVRVLLSTLWLRS